MVAMRAFWMGVPLDCAVDDLVAESALGARREGGCCDRLPITDLRNHIVKLKPACVFSGLRCDPLVPVNVIVKMKWGWAAGLCAIMLIVAVLGIVANGGSCCCEEGCAHVLVVVQYSL
jgi:hypothetical protein